MNTKVLEEKVNREEDYDVYDDQSEAERQNDDGTEEKLEERLQKPVEEGECRRHNEQLEERSAEADVREEIIGDPEAEKIGEDRDKNFKERTHGGYYVRLLYQT
jgi:hypothetical protein